MRLITLFEHQSRSFEDLKIRPDHKVWEVLDEINRKAGQELIRIEHKGIRAAEYAGVIRAGEITFQVLPKIDCGGSNSSLDTPAFEKAASSAVQNLLFMLSYAFDLNLSAQDLAQLDTRCSTWFEVLTRLFATDLHRQIQMGVPQNYIQRAETLAVIRGKWDLTLSASPPSIQPTYF